MRKFSHSSMSTWRRCRMRYYWQYVKNYKPGSGAGQLRGSAGHAALAHWYGAERKAAAEIEIEEEEIRIVQEALQKAADVYNNFESSTGQDMSDGWDLTQLVIRRYFEWSKYNETITAIQSLEQKFEMVLGGIPVIGYIDGVVEVGDSLWLLENKFNKQVSVANIDLDPQISLYMLAAYKCGIDARGVLFNIVRVAEGGIAAKEPVVRTQVFRNQEGLAIIEAETILQLQEMTEFHDKGGRIYRNCTKDCSWDCSFYEVCLSMNDNGDSESMLARIPIVPHIDEPEAEKGEI